MLTYRTINKDFDDKDQYFDDVVKIIQETGKISASLIQRKLNLGYARSARILDQLEKCGIIGPAKGDKPREIHISHIVNGKMVEGKVEIPKPEPIQEEPKVEWSITKLVMDQEKLVLEIGEDENQEPIKFNFEKYNNLLIVGSQYTGSTKLLNNILFNSVVGYHPDNLRLIVIDGSQNDVILPSGLPHLLTPLIAEPEKVISALRWSWSEIVRRMKLDSQVGFPKVLLVINSFNQLMMFSPREIEDNLYQILASGRKYGFYCVLGTDLISSIPKTILANIPAKIVFKPADEKLTKDTGVPESKDLNSPDEAILEMMFEKQKKIKISETNQEIYKEIIG